MWQTSIKCLCKVLNKSIVVYHRQVEKLVAHISWQHSESSNAYALV